MLICSSRSANPSKNEAKQLAVPTKKSNGVCTKLNRLEMILERSQKHGDFSSDDVPIFVLEIALKADSFFGIFSTYNTFTNPRFYRGPLAIFFSSFVMYTRKPTI